MRPARFGVLLLSLFVSVSAWCQQTTNPVQAFPPPGLPGLASSGPAQPQQLPTAGQGTAFLQRALAAQTAGSTIKDVTMTGTTTILVNPQTKEKQTGTISITLASGERSQAVVNLPSGARTMTRSVSNGIASAKSVGPDGVSVAAPSQTALSPHPYNAFPAMLLNVGLSSSGNLSSHVGPETRNGTPVEHIAVWRIPNGASPTDAGKYPGFQRATEHEIYLDPATLLPTALTFYLHPFDAKNPKRPIVPYRNSQVDALEEIRYSDYRLVQGTPVAFHMEIYIRNVLVQEIQLSSVAFNTGATISGN